MISSDNLAFMLVVIQGSLVEERTQTALQILALVNLKVQYEEWLERDCRVLAPFNVELCPHHATENVPDQAFLSETGLTVVEVLLLTSCSHFVPGRLVFLFIHCRITCMHQDHFFMELVKDQDQEFVAVLMPIERVEA